ncbi:MAG: bile acid:sodium symporter [Xanthomonadaceae bacterium]|nr:bile acid:sodium symporter [Xanthomonadaceae bacterium]
MNWLNRLRNESFTLALLATVGLATLAPVRGTLAGIADVMTDLAIAVLFFLHGARLSHSAIVSGMTAWRLHLLVFASTFLLFPLLGLTIKPLSHWILTPELYIGVLFLCALPSTVQSSIAFTSIAGGNIPAAVCSASASNLLGVFLTPLLMSMLAGRVDGTADPIDAIAKIMLQLLVPFVAGHLSRPRIGAWIERHRSILRYTDQSTILLVVYTAFSASVIQGLWQNTPPAALFGLIAVSCFLLAVVMLLLVLLARKLGFSRQDEIAIVFCGSKKSLATGVPMAKVLFATGSLGAIVLPIMLFHQIQLIVCAFVAQRYARNNQRHQ